MKRIKCFFGFHNWKMIDVVVKDPLSDDQIVTKRFKCSRCSLVIESNGF